MDEHSAVYVWHESKKEKNHVYSLFNDIETLPMADVQCKVECRCSNMLSDIMIIYSSK